MITTIRKIVKIGSSDGVTLPAKELRRANLKPGDEVKVTIESVAPDTQHEKLMHEYEVFVKQYGDTLKNLADR